MFIQGPHGIGSKDKVFLHCESALSLSRGTVVVWDHTDYTATAGIRKDLRGIRVTTSNTAEHCGVVGVTEADTTGVAGRINRAILVQVYGYHDAVPILNITAGAIAAGTAVLIQGATAAGVAEFRTRGGATPIKCSMASFGFNFQEIPVGFSTAKGFIRGMF